MSDSALKKASVSQLRILLEILADAKQDLARSRIVHLKPFPEREAAVQWLVDVIAAEVWEREKGREGR